MEHRKKAVAGLIGLDIGGTKIEGILWQGGRLRRARKISTPKSRSRFLTTLLNLIEDLSAGYRLNGIGIAMAGVLDTTRGVVIRSPNLKFLNGVQLFGPLQKKFRKPVLMDNDANCFLRGELAFGQARGKKDVVALTLGTGVGGAVSAGGRLLTGKHGVAGELGHTVIAGGNGKFFNLEDLVSSHGFRRLGVRDPLAWQIRAFAGDPKAKRVYEAMGRYLGIGLANLVNIFDPEIIILGGGISRAGRLLLIPARREMKRYALLPAAQLPPIRFSRLSYPAALGAVTLFFQ